MRDLLCRRIEGSATTIASLGDQIDDLASVIELVRSTLGAGGTIYTAGNGGSAAQSLHLSEELIGRYRSNRPPFRAICLNADPSALTCIANDFGFDQIFARQCEALLTPSDALIVLSTSGNSANIVNALKVAQSKRCMTIGLLGRGGGECRGLCDRAVTVSSTDSAHIQEAHQVIIHLICEALEDR